MGLHSQKHGIADLSHHEPATVAQFNALLSDGEIGGGMSFDAFGRQRVSRLAGLFDIQNQYNKSPLLWDEITAGTASSTHLPNESSIRLDIGTASGDRVARQTHLYYRYQPGRSQLIIMTAVLGSSKTNVVRRIGYFDDDNGVFFEQDENGIAVVVRSKASGTVVNTKIAQANWNLDKLDGTGDSGHNLDLTKAQIFLIDLQWLGVGAVRFGFDLDGEIVYCHQARHANSVDKVYMTSANLPLRYELTNTGVSVSSSSIKQICCFVASEDGESYLSQPGYQFAAGNESTLKTVNTTRAPIISIRPKTAFNSLENRAIVVPQGISLYGSGVLYFELVQDGTLTGALFGDVDNNSCVEYDTAATAISGGIVKRAGYIQNKGVENISGDLSSKIPLAVNAAGDAGDVLTLCARTTGGNDDVGGALQWKEIY